MVATHNLKTSVSSQLHGQLGGLPCSLLDLGLGGVDRDAQRAHKVNKAIEDLEHCLRWASHCEVIHNSNCRHRETSHTSLVDRLHHCRKA